MPILRQVCTGATCSEIEPSSQDSTAHLCRADPVPTQLLQDPINPVPEDAEPAGSQPLQPLWWENPLALDNTALTSASLQISRTEILRVSSAVKAATKKPDPDSISPKPYLRDLVGKPEFIVAAHAAEGAAQEWSTGQQADADATVQSQPGHAGLGHVTRDHFASHLTNVQRSPGSSMSEGVQMQGQNSVQPGFTFVAGCHHARSSSQEMSCLLASAEPGLEVPDSDSIMDGASGRRVLADVVNRLQQTPGHKQATQRIWKAASGTRIDPAPASSFEAVSLLLLLLRVPGVNREGQHL